jgi:CheY-like chemotaxis protein
MRAHLRAILTAIGHECQEATNGIQALDYIRHNQVDLVVTDLDMPGMNGFQ